MTQQFIDLIYRRYPSGAHAVTRYYDPHLADKLLASGDALALRRYLDEVSWDWRGDVVHDLRDSAASLQAAEVALLDTLSRNVDRIAGDVAAGRWATWREDLSEFPEIIEEVENRGV